MTLEMDGVIEELQSRWGGSSGLTDGQEDISDGTSVEVGDVTAFSLYLSAAGAVIIDVELSPDGGSTWYTAPESPVEFTESDDDIVHIEYNATNVRLTGQSTTLVEAQLREVV